MAKSENLSIRDLWHAVIKQEDDMAALYAHLRDLYTMLNETEEENLITPKGLKKLTRILSGVHYKPKMKCLASAVLSLISQPREIKIRIVESGAGQAIIDILKELLLLAREGVHLSELEVLLIEQLLKLTQMLCHECRAAQRMLTENGLIRVIGEICDPSRSPLFEYSGESVKTLKEFTQQKNLVGQLKPLSQLHLMEIYHSQFGDSYKSLLLPQKGYSVELYDTTVEDKDIVISEELVFGGHFLYRNDKSSETSDSWLDIMVTEVVDKCHMWCHVGGDSIHERITDVQNVLQKTYTPDRTLRKPPMPRNLVCGKHDTVGFYRAQVLSYHAHEADVFLLDYGIKLTVDWSSLNLCNPEMNLGCVPPLAVPCALEGIGPLPRDPSIITHGLTTLCNICSSNFATDDILKPDGVSSVVLELCQCWSPGITYLACATISNWSQSREIRTRLGKMGTVKILLDVCCSFSKREPWTEEVSRALMSILSTLANLVYDHDSNRKKLVEAGGLDVLPALAYQTTSPRVKQRALRVIRNMFGENLKWATNNIRGWIKTADSSGNGDQPMQQQPGSQSHNRWDGRPRTHSQTSHSSRDDSTSEREEKALPRFRFEEEDSSDDDALFGHRSSASGTDTDGELMIGGGRNGSSGSPRTPLLSDVSTVVPIGANDRYYVKGNLMTQKSDSLHEFREITHMHKASAETISKLICGFLNAGKGGSIFFGIPKQVIRGVRMTRGDRDSLRLGVDSMMTRLFPAVLHSQYEVSYYPVAAQKGHSDPSTRSYLTDLSIIEIKLQPSSRSVFYTTLKGKSFIREGGTTKPLSYPDVYTRVTEETEEEFLREIRMLERDLERRRGHIRKT